MHAPMHPGEQARMHARMHGHRGASVHACMQTSCMCARRCMLQISYEVSLGFSPTEGPVNVSLEAPVGVVISPSRLTFEKENWSVPRLVQVQVTNLFPAAPLVSLCCL